MLKNSKTFFFLIPLVVIIWGAVIYKVVDALSEEPESQSELSLTAPIKKHIIERDTFSLIEIDRDPFLGKLYTRERVKKSNNENNNLVMEWPAIEYLGMVSDPDSRSKVYLIVINGKSFFMEKGSETESVSLVKASGNKVWLRYKNSTKAFQI